MEKSRKKSYKIQSFTELAIAIAVVVLLNIVCTSYFFRIDLTAEKRYSLSNTSKELAKNVDADMFFKVYLEGEFPAGFKRLSRAVKEMLDEFRVYSGNNINYQFIDPFKDATDKQSADIVEELNAKGLIPTNVQIKKEDEFAQKIIIPGAIVYYKGVEYPLNFLKGQFGQGPEETINSSIELLEYEIANVLRKATETKVKKIAIVDDNTDFMRWDIAEATAMLSEFYKVEKIKLSLEIPERLQEFAGIILAKPTQTFSDFDKFKLDQYIMHGGKVLWLIETQLAHMDSLRNTDQFVTITYPTNVEDMLFRYGVRVNQNLIQDLQCNAIPVLSGMKSGVPQQKLLPWPYFPVVTPYGNHPVVRGVEPVWHQFVNSIDTLTNMKVKKTILLQTSPYSRVLASPSRVDLNVSRLDLQPEIFRKGPGFFNTAVLLEGNFSSIFKYKIDATDKDAAINFKQESDFNKMIVVSDGDVIRNQFKQSTGEVFPLGYDRYTKQQFGNKKFILNCIDYLCDESGIINIRNKEITLRLLDKGMVKKYKNQFIAINLISPLVLVILFGIINHFIRKKRYTQKAG
ncbi:MAG: gliding motility-associated ABC transporter substrate-binding protein GldG [Bacteroidia bacterium]